MEYPKLEAQLHRSLTVQEAAFLSDLQAETGVTEDALVAKASAIRPFSCRKLAIAVYEAQMFDSPADEFSVWKEKGFSADAIAYAQERTLAEKGQSIPAYTAGILRRWLAAGLLTREAVLNRESPAPAASETDAEEARNSTRQLLRWRELMKQEE